MEMLHIPRKMHLETWRRRISLAKPGPVLSRLLKGGPIIMLTGHFGNWEMAGYLFGVFGFPPHSVARNLDNPYLDRFLKSFRERTGQKMIPKTGGYDQILEVLNSKGVLSFLADQDAGERGDVRGVLRAAGLDAQVDRPAGDRAQGPGVSGICAAGRARVPLRDRL